MAIRPSHTMLHLLRGGEKGAQEQETIEDQNTKTLHSNEWHADHTENTKTMSSFPIVASEIKGAADLTRRDLNDAVTNFMNGPEIQKLIKARFGERLHRLGMIEKMVDVAGEGAIIDLDAKDFAVIADHMRRAEDR